MSATPTRLLIISRDALLDALSEKDTRPLFRSIAALQHRGLRLLLTAAEPDRWLPTRKNVDSALNTQRELLESFRAAGGDLEGVYYVPRSLLTQDRNREFALKDILRRYSLPADEATLISSSNPFVRAAQRLGLRAFECAPANKAGLTLNEALKRVIQPL